MHIWHYFSSRFTRNMALLLSLSVCTHTGLRAQHTTHPPQGFISIFNGRDLSDWAGDASFWRVENGSIVGEVLPHQQLQHNSFLIWNGVLSGDFELRVEYRVSADGNSGINYRSSVVKDIPWALRGYQGDIDGRDEYTGQVYEERGRTTLAYRWERSRILPFPDTARFSRYIQNNNWLNRQVEGRASGQEQAGIRTASTQWRRYRIVAAGHLIRHYVDDVLVSEIRDEDGQHRTHEGKIGVQVHVGPPMKIEFRNFFLKQIHGPEKGAGAQTDNPRPGL